MKSLSQMWQAVLNETLEFSAQCGYLPLIKPLIRAGADPNANDGGPLMFASGQDNIRTIKALLKNGADVHRNNDIALRYATWGDSKKAIAVLKAAMERQPPETAPQIRGSDPKRINTPTPKP